MDWFTRCFSLAFVGVVSSLFTTFLARKSFISERWWDRKADAYTRILEALVEMDRYHEAHYDDLTNEAQLSEERKAELTTAWKTAALEVDNSIRIGAFVISQEAHSALAKLRTATRGVHPQDFFGTVEANYTATSECIRQMREIGRTDLQVDARWWLSSPFSRLVGRLRRGNLAEAAKP